MPKRFELSQSHYWAPVIYGKLVNTSTQTRFGCISKLSYLQRLKGPQVQDKCWIPFAENLIHQAVWPALKLHPPQAPTPQSVLSHVCFQSIPKFSWDRLRTKPHDNSNIWLKLQRWLLCCAVTTHPLSFSLPYPTVYTRINHTLQAPADTWTDRLV